MSIGKHKGMQDVFESFGEANGFDVVKNGFDTLFQPQPPMHLTGTDIRDKVNAMHALAMNLWVEDPLSKGRFLHLVEDICRITGLRTLDGNMAYPQIAVKFYQLVTNQVFSPSVFSQSGLYQPGEYVAGTFSGHGETWATWKAKVSSSSTPEFAMAAGTQDCTYSFPCIPYDVVGAVLPPEEVQSSLYCEPYNGHPYKEMMQCYPFCAKESDNGGGCDFMVESAADCQGEDGMAGDCPCHCEAMNSTNGCQTAYENAGSDLTLVDFTQVDTNGVTLATKCPEMKWRADGLYGCAAFHGMRKANANDDKPGDIQYEKCNSELSPNDVLSKYGDVAPYPCPNPPCA
jgi:hypothetical protein